MQGPATRCAARACGQLVHAAGCAVARLPPTQDPSPQDCAISSSTRRKPVHLFAVIARRLPRPRHRRHRRHHSAFLAHLQSDPRCALAVGLGPPHPNQRSILTTRGVIAAAASSSRPRPVALHHPRRRPAAWPPRHARKRLGQLNYAQMEVTFRTNTFGPGAGPICTAVAQNRARVCWLCCRPRWAALATTAWAAGTASPRQQGRAQHAGQNRVHRSGPHPSAGRAGGAAPRHRQLGAVGLFNGAEIGTTSRGCGGDICGCSTGCQRSKPAAFTPTAASHRSW